MIGHLANDIIQIVSRIDIMVSACCQQRADDSSRLPYSANFSVRPLMVRMYT